MNNDISVHEPSERVKALRDAAGAVCTSCASGKKPDLLKNFFVRWWHDTFHPCPASPIHDLIAQEIAAAKVAQEEQARLDNRRKSAQKPDAGIVGSKLPM